MTTNPDIRVLAEFPVVNPDGSVDTIFVAAMRDGAPATWEKRPTGERLDAVFTWSTARLAISVAMANAGWGHLSAHFASKADQETVARIEQANRVNGVRAVSA